MRKPAKQASVGPLPLVLHGFYSGRRNNTVVDVHALERIADKVEEYCRSNRDMPLMQAVESTLGGVDRAVGSKK
jgi:hypothetical protein